MTSLAARILLALVLCLAAASGGWRIGVKTTLADWRAADLARADADAESGRLNRRSMDKAAAEFEATRRAIATRQPEIAHDLRYALSAPISCPAAASAPLADLRIPAAVVRGLRRSGEDRSAEPGASAPGR